MKLTPETLLYCAQARVDRAAAAVLHAKASANTQAIHRTERAHRMAVKKLLDAENALTGGVR
jgi:hypothetical protein